MKILCIKLNSGEEIVGRVSNNFNTSQQFLQDGTLFEAKGKVVLEKVRVITIQPLGNNQIGVGFVPWSMGNVDGMQLFTLENCASSVYNPSKDIEDGYIQQTSDIQIAKPGLTL